MSATVLAAAWAKRGSLVDLDGDDVYVVDVPAGEDAHAPPLLVIHGFPTSSVDFDGTVDRIAQHRRVVLMDLPGYGMSVKLDRPYSLFGQADVVEAVVAHCGLDEVDLLTHDMGDSVGGELLARSLDGDLGFAVRRRVLTNGSIYLDLAHLTPGQHLLRDLPDELLPDEVAPTKDALRDAFAELCGDDLTDAARAALGAAAELVVREGGNRLLARLIRYLDERAEHESRWTTAIERHPAPLTVIWGKHDPIAVPEMVELLESRRDDTEVVWLDAGHWPMVEHSAAFAEATVAALDA